MWLCVDRVEGDTVILLDDRAAVYSLPRADYLLTVGLEPRESDVLSAVTDGTDVLSASFDESETRRRREAARKRLNRLFGRSGQTP